MASNVYDIDWKNAGKNLLYNRWRRNNSGNKSILLVIIESVMASIQVLQDKLFSLQQETTVFLSYTGQHLALEALLNDNYDNVQRRIYIQENNTAPVEPIELALTSEASQNPIEFGLSGEVAIAPIDLGLSTENFTFANFSIIYPSTVFINESEARGKLANYVLAAKNYDFIQI